MTTKQPLREILGAAARVWVKMARPGKAPEPFEHYEYVGGRWVWIRVQYNGEEKPPARRKEDRYPPSYSEEGERDE